MRSACSLGTKQDRKQPESIPGSLPTVDYEAIVEPTDVEAEV